MTLQIPDPVIGTWAKSFPTRLYGMPISAIGDADVRLSEFSTPAFTVHEAALAHNEQTVFDWAAGLGVHIAPHGKTTMSPALWQRLLDAGSWGISVATPWQARVAIDAGVPTVFIANAVTDQVAVRELSAILDATPHLRLLCWADSVETITILARATAGARRPLEVLVELGGPHGRTGARTVAEGQQIAEAIHAAPGLRLAGVAGYEGPFGGARTAADEASVDGYLRTLVELHQILLPQYDDAYRPVLSAGGSSWPDRATAVLAPSADTADVVLRSGAFQIHDDGFYTRMAPFGREVATEPLRSAMHAWARVVSRPEPQLALLDAGRRDVPFDIDLPMPQTVSGAVIKLNDQHAFLQLAEGATVSVGDVVRLGLSHPCTAFDKWRLVPVIDNPDADDPRVIGAVATIF